VCKAGATDPVLRRTTADDADLEIRQQGYAHAGNCQRTQILKGVDPDSPGPPVTTGAHADRNCHSSAYFRILFDAPQTLSITNTLEWKR
jgi:hypothetical protein